MIGIIICSRLKSSRLPNKAHLLLENRTVISHLVNNIKGLGIPIVVTVPNSDLEAYFNDGSFPRGNNILIHNSEHENDPLARTHQVAKQFGFTTIIRITHDKIFIDTESLINSLLVFTKEKADYLYPTGLIPGTNYEIMSYGCLSEAARKFKNVEYLSYALRDVSKKTINHSINQSKYSMPGLSLLLDYPEDYKLLQVIYSRLGVNCRFPDAIDYLNKHRELFKINKKPIVSIYTCAFNSERFLSNAMDSALGQNIISDCEYILIDDHSSDSTYEIMAKGSVNQKNVIIHRNERNLGLATSSNIALGIARGKYIIRLDSDDVFSQIDSVKKMMDYSDKYGFEVLYPDNYFGSYDKIQKGNEHNHVGGAMFNKAALNYIKFTDGLRGYEGYDLFLRAKDRLRIGYYNHPTFLYSQRDGSMSRSNTKFRQKIKSEIEVRIKNEKV